MSIFFKDVIPLLKENIDRECDQEMMLKIRERILNLVHEQEKDQVYISLGWCMCE